MTDIRIIPTAALTASLAALLLFVIQHPHAAMWAAVVALVLAVCGLFTLTDEEMTLRAERDEAREDVADLTAALAEATAALAAVGRPLRLVPTQRDGIHDHLPVADGAFPIHTTVDDDDLTALMRATEEKK